MLAAAILVLAPACGGGPGGSGGTPGTVFLHNETDLGMAPQVITEFYLQAADGSGPTPTNLLLQPLDPGDIVTIGLFPPGLYNATAVLQGSGNVSWMDTQIRSGEPTDFVVP